MRLIAFLLIFLFSATTVSAQTSPQHPFLLVRSDQYAQLQAQSLQAPYSAMKTDAINTCNNLQYSSATSPCPGTSYGASHCMRHIMSSCALAYIVDPNNKQTYLNKVASVLPRWEDIIIVQSGADDGTRDTSNEFYNIAGAAYFNSLLTIDNMWHDLEQMPWSSNLNYPRQFTSQLDYALFLMEQEYNHWYGPSKPVYNFLLRNGSYLTYNMPERHPPAKAAILIMYKIFTGTFNPGDSDSQTLLYGGTFDGFPGGGYLPEVNARINESGVYTEGASYAYAGWGSDRDERAHLIDVLEFTGKDVEFGLDFYTNPRWQSFMEWLYGYASTPFGMHTSFGDTYAYRMLPEQVGFGTIIAKSSRTASAGKFGNTAGSYALWKSNNLTPDGRFLNYVLRSQNTTVSTPSSKIYSNGGGFFFSQPVSDQSLYGVLWNVRQPTEGSAVFHVRRDTNAIYLSAYGAPLLMNGGFCGSSSPAGPDSCAGQDENNVQTRFSGEYLGHRAVSNNVGMVNYTIGSNYITPNDDGNTSNFGSGIVEGFTSMGFDYANANFDGFADPTAAHSRSFVFAHPSANTNGYFLLFDEFTGVSQGQVHTVLHPNASARQEVTPLTDYNLTVGRRAFADASTGLGIFYATPPQTVQFTRGIIASASDIGSYIPEYLFASYPVDTNGQKHATTVLFPYNSTHPKPPISRISGSGFSGATINHGSNITDTAIESSGTVNIMHSNTSFQGLATWFRKSGNMLTAYFVRRGMSFSNNDTVPTGFTSSQSISVYLNDTSGNIVSPGTAVTFYYPGVTGVRLNNQNLSNLSTGSGWVRVNIPAGTHNLTLLSTGQPTPTPIPVQTLLSSWLTSTNDQNGDNKVNSVDFGTIIP